MILYHSSIILIYFSTDLPLAPKKVKRKTTHQKYTNYNLEEEPEEMSYEEKLSIYKNTPEGKFVYADVSNLDKNNAGRKLNIPESGGKSGRYSEMVDRQMYNENFEKVKMSEARFYAFLNKEFNIINKKSINLSKHSLFCNPI